MHVSEMLCVFQRCCARVGDVVHVSQQLCTFHRSCACFTSPPIMFVFNRTGATKHVLPICHIYLQTICQTIWQNSVLGFDHSK